MVAKPLPVEAVGDAARAISWSAYDPTEGRMDSDDPLGFAAGALRLADQILPGLTVRTINLRYYPMICAGLLAVEDADQDFERRRRFMIWEKLWALARVSTQQGQGVIGVNGAGRHLASQHRRRLDGRYVLIQRQPFLGALGSYSTSLEALELKRPGSVQLTDAGRELGTAGFRVAASKFARNLLEAVRLSIRSERDHIAESTKYGVSHAYLAAVGELDGAASATLRDRLFDHTTSRGRATRLALPAMRGADVADLAALNRLAGSGSQAADLAKLARHALALEEVTCAADWALEWIIGLAVGNGFAINAETVARDPGWALVEQQLRRAAANAMPILADASLPREHSTAATLAELRGITLVRELVLHHERVMTGRTARHWASLDDDRIYARRVQPLPVAPAPIRHAYRFEAARRLALQAGLR